MTLSPHPNSARSARATLLAMADPKQSGVDPLGDEGQAALRELVEAARLFGPTTTLATASGSGGDAPTAERLLDEAGRHDVIVLLAHGKAAENEGGAILLVDDNGKGEWMSAGDLARRPHSFDGAVIVLLSCDAGHVGNEFAEASGVAGTLLSAGAVAVVAPLWPVGLDAATSVGISVLRGIADGLTPWEALQGSSRTTRQSPRLGRPPARSADRDAARRSDQLAWVTWVC